MCSQESVRSYPKKYYEKFIPKEGIPDRIFKYANINENSKAALREGYLWFSRPDDFNDPFDCYRELVYFENSKDYVKKLIIKRLGNLSRSKRREESRRLTADPHLINRIYKEILSDQIKKIGICCFSTSCDNILMWSHYASNHQGLCLTFDPNFNLRHFLVAGVQYVEEFKKYNYFDDTEDALMIMAVTKSIEWAYENEVRIILPEENGKRMFPKQALKSVIFGCRTSPEAINEIKNIIDSSNYSNVSFHQMHLEKDRFKLIMKDL